MAWLFGQIIMVTSRTPDQGFIIRVVSTCFTKGKKLILDQVAIPNMTNLRNIVIYIITLSSRNRQSFPSLSHPNQAFATNTDNNLVNCLFLLIFILVILASRICPVTQKCTIF